jgi:hypothetical protein
MKNPQDTDKQRGMMHECMRKMHEHMHKLMDAKNPQQRESLVQEDLHMLPAYVSHERRRHDERRHDGR